MSQGSSDLGFDAKALEAKYRIEREKRIRTEGNEQFVKLEGKFAHYLSDPFSPRIERGPLHIDINVAVLGGGFGGMLSAVRLLEAGVRDVHIIEKGSDFGGVWYWNRYPGAACDTEAYVYLPLLEEVGYLPPRNFANGAEIFAHAKAIGAKYGLYHNAIFQTEIKEMHWAEESSRWIIHTDRDDVIRARYVIMSSGPLTEPKLPGIRGIETFEGHSFHTSRWDFNYTGGDGSGNLTKLSDKRVGIIGTGATAIQAIPHLGEWAKQLYVFQRTPSSIGIRDERPTDPEWARSLEPGWQKRYIENLTALIEGHPVAEDLLDDGWTRTPFQAMQKIKPGMSLEEIGQIFKDADYRYMEEIRRRVDEIVEDKATAEALKPWYNRLCKRQCFHDSYLQTFNRPNVKLVDTNGQGVDRITPHGVVVDSKEYEIDCLIFATGFELAAYTNRAVMPMYGRRGMSLTEKWEHGATTLHGFYVHNFPNFFLLSTTQSAWGINFPHMIAEQAAHLAYVIKEAEARGAKEVEVTAHAEEAWVVHHEENAERLVQIWRDCTPSYYNLEGKPSPVLVRNGGYGPGVIKMVELLEHWRKEGKLEGLQLTF